ncbi:MAG: hypothetical protein V8Q79_09930 [Christensenellales bacterium]
MEFSICRVNQSDLDELTAVEAICFPKRKRRRGNRLPQDWMPLGTGFLRQRTKTGKSSA